MESKRNILALFYSLFLSEKTKENSEKVIITIAIISFLLHITLILIKDIIPGG